MTMQCTITFFLKGTKMRANSRPGETYPYVSSPSASDQVSAFARELLLLTSAISLFLEFFFVTDLCNFLRTDLCIQPPQYVVYLLKRGVLQSIIRQNIGWAYRQDGTIYKPDSSWTSQQYLTWIDEFIQQQVFSIRRLIVQPLQ